MRPFQKEKRERTKGWLQEMEGPARGGLEHSRRGALFPQSLAPHPQAWLCSEGWPWGQGASEGEDWLSRENGGVR